MLDKSIPYVGLYMRRPAGKPIAQVPLPYGYDFTFYKSGDELDWARLETSVLEFSSEFAALLHFKERFIPYPDELAKRCLFIENECGEKIATATAWWSVVNDERRPWLQWVSVDPSHQGLGLGKALIHKVTEIMMSLEGDADFYLQTQTWSHKAIRIYVDIGYLPTAEKTLYRSHKDNYKKAMKFLEERGILNKN